MTNNTTSARPHTPSINSQHIPLIPSTAFHALMHDIKAFRTALHLLATAPRSTHTHTIASLESTQSSLIQQLQAMKSELLRIGDELAEHEARILDLAAGKAGVKREEMLLTARKARDELEGLVGRRATVEKDMKFYARRLDVVKYGVGRMGRGVKGVGVGVGAARSMEVEMAAEAVTGSDVETETDTLTYPETVMEDRADTDLPPETNARLQMHLDMVAEMAKYRLFSYAEMLQDTVIYAHPEMDAETENCPEASAQDEEEVGTDAERDTKEEMCTEKEFGWQDGGDR